MVTYSLYRDVKAHYLRQFKLQTDQDLMKKITELKTEQARQAAPITIDESEGYTHTASAAAREAEVQRSRELATRILELEEQQVSIGV